MDEQFLKIMKNILGYYDYQNWTVVISKLFLIRMQFYLIICLTT